MKSIKSKLMVLLLLGITIIIGISGLWVYQKENREDLADYLSLRDTLQKRLALSLPNNAWAMNENALRQIVNAELNWSSLVAIRIADGSLNFGRVKDHGQVRDMRPDEAVPSDDTVVVPILYEGRQLGSATAYLSREKLVSKQRIRLAHIVGQVVASGGLILILMTWALGYFVFDPLTKLREALDLVARSNEVHTAKLTIGQNDEFGTVIRSFNGIVERIQGDLAQLTMAERVAKEEKIKAESAYQQLLETQKTLVEAEKLASLGALVAGVAHEINTPVGISLTTASQLEYATRKIESQLQSGAIRKSDFQSYLATARESCDLILSNSDRAANLIQSFKRVAVDQTSEARRDFGLADYLHEIITSLKPRLRRKHIQVEIECDSDIKLDSYPGALSQVITNLVLNALAHAFDEGDTGTITIRARQLPTHQVRLTIVDNGCGIPSSFIHRIFEPFFTTKRGKGGSGLGLHIVYNIVRQQLAGSIEVESTVGQGTIFAIIMPNIAPPPVNKEQA